MNRNDVFNRPPQDRSSNQDDDETVTSTFGDGDGDCPSVNLLEDTPPQRPPRMNTAAELSSSVTKHHQHHPKVLYASPATQTLNVLSQNMDDLRYDMTSNLRDEAKKDEERQQKTAKATKTKTGNSSSRGKDKSTKDRCTTARKRTTKSKEVAKKNQDTKKKEKSTAADKDKLVVLATATTTTTTTTITKKDPPIPVSKQAASLKKKVATTPFKPPTWFNSHALESQAPGPLTPPPRLKHSLAATKQSGPASSRNKEHGSSTFRAAWNSRSSESRQPPKKCAYPSFGSLSLEAAAPSSKHPKPSAKADDASGKNKTLLSVLQRPSDTKDACSNKSESPPKKKKIASEESDVGIPTPSSQQQPTRLNWNDYQDDYHLFPICIENQGPLGMLVIRSFFPGLSSSSSISLSSSETDAQHCHCQVQRVFDNSLAQKQGLQTGDWICELDPTRDLQKLLLLEYTQVQEWAKQRPFVVHALREKQSKEESASTSTSTSTITSILPPLKKQRVSSSSSTHTPESSSSSVAPTNNPGEAATTTADSPPKRAKSCNIKSRPSSSTGKDGPTSVDRRSHDKLFISTKVSTATAKVTTEAATSAKDDRLSDESSIEEIPRPKITQAASSSIKDQLPKSGQGRNPNGTQASRSTKDSVLSRSTSNIQPLVSSTQNSKEKPKLVLKNPSAPFCRLCNHTPGHRKVRMHHAWCSHNDFFDHSGARELMKRVRQGRRLECPACEAEFQSGKLAQTPTKHCVVCVKNQKRLKSIEEERERIEERQEQQRKKRMKEQALKRKRTQREEIISSAEEEDDMDDVSVYRPKKKKHRIQTLSVGGKQPKSKAMESHDKASSQARYSLVTPQLNFEPIAASTGRRGELIKPSWVATSDNPWGKVGYELGDVLMYGPQPGLGHFETVLPSRRYTMSPFAFSSAYRFTHCTPQEGVTMLSLRRDPLATCPWGFRAIWDEFGHACLVESVDAMSPASAATYVGMPECEASAPGLKANDLILMMNGKPVGGMTEIGFEIELEASGPVVQLGVSRYKHADDAAKKFAEMERQMLQVMDSAARDNRLIGWVEVGNSGSLMSSGLLEDADTVGEGGQPQETRTSEHESSSFNITSPSCSDDIGEICDGASTAARIRKGYPDTNSSLISQKILIDEFNRDDREDDAEANGFSSGSESLAIFRSPVDGSPKNEDWDMDENACLGCVCGTVHSKSRSTEIFWIQCESCESWYDVHTKCVGFSMQQAKAIKSWTCWACPDSQSIGTAQSLPPPNPTSVELDPDIERAIIQEQIVQNNSDRGLLRASSEETNSSENDKSLEVTENNSALVETGDNLREMDYVLHNRLATELIPNWDSLIGQTKKVWLPRVTREGILPKSQPRKLNDGSFKKPTGVAPFDLRWDKHRGLWAPKSIEAKSSVVEADRKMNDLDRSRLAAEMVPNWGSLFQNEAKRKEWLPRITPEGFLPRSQLKLSDGSFQKPAGLAPFDLSWDKHLGLWVPEAESSAAKVGRNMNETDRNRLAAEMILNWDSLPFHQRRIWLLRVTPEGFRPNTQPPKRDDGSFRHPPGKVAFNLRWDRHRGLWVPKRWLPKKQEVPNQRELCSSPQTEAGSLVEERITVSSSDNPNVSHSRRSKPSVEIEVIQGSGDSNIVFEKGDLVCVEPHAWAGKNCEGGVGHITSSRLNEDGDLVYHVKFVVGASDKSVDAEFIRAYSFS